MSHIDKELWDPEDILKTKEELKKAQVTIPCNIWGMIKKILEEIDELKKVIGIEKSH